MNLKQCIKPLLTLVIRFLGLLPIQNKILFSAFSARVYGDNPKYIAEEVLSHKLKVKCIFVVRNPENTHVPNGIKLVKYNSFRYLYELATSKVWVDNTRKQDFVVKRKNQIYIQTWHGSIAFKKIEKDIESYLSKTYLHTAQNDSKMIDFLLVNCKFAQVVYQSAFWNPQKIVVTGSPRLDQLVRKNPLLANSALDRLGLDSTKKYILYAPTFRDNGDTQVYNIDFQKIVKAAEVRFGGKWQVVLKLHPNIEKEKVVVSDSVIDASKYPDIMELYALCSILITDYSSTMFDFALTGKPVFLYVPDLEEYLLNRPTYFKMDELPFSSNKDLQGLSLNIKNFDDQRYKQLIKQFYKKLNILEDGFASNRVVDIMRKYIF
ncbi:CDP-glycerol glycerophosphotransferase family protein [Lactiplantibacillus songbeiensis]|uniref:CDP-glycerol glycerophosphotransferase family protein n=1 Tax=Lactiplantibacillus songbeiensis TaxID=2559920 RepID=A0ABW4C3P0_9LACO|nr:CDP-glycerol glycerophosphotransferase family protein [Lactiplantibacillus songbeiensis]